MQYHDSCSPSQRSSFSDRVRASFQHAGEKIEQGTLTGAILNTLCNVMGAGVLSMSFAMYNASIGFGIILLVYSAICSGIASFILAKGCDETQVYTMKEVLAHAMYPATRHEEVRRHHFTGEADAIHHGVFDQGSAMSQYAAEEAQINRKRRMVIFAINVIIFLYNYGTLIVYGRVIADSIPPVVEDFLHGSGFWIQSYTWLGLAGVLFFVLSCARNMEELKWSSLLGFMTIFYIVVIVVVRAITNVSHKVVPPTPETTEVSYFHFTMATFKSITTYGLAFCYHYNVPYYYKELKDHTPKKFMVVVGVCLPIITICYGLVGVCGYLTFGAAVGDAAAGGNIVNNYPKDDLLVNIGRLGLFFHFVSVYPILSVSARRGLHALLFQRNVGDAERNTLLPSGHSERTDEDLCDIDNNRDPTTPQIICEAFFLVSTTVVIAYFVPGVGIVIEISGCLFGVFLMFLVPGLIGLHIFSGSYKSQSTVVIVDAMNTDRQENVNDYFDDGASSVQEGKKCSYWYLALFQLITGIVFMITASSSLIYGFATGNGTS